KPILVRRCLECHSGLAPKGKLDLTTRTGALKVVVPGKPNDSELWQRVDAGEMPPKKPLADSEKKLLRAWVESGAGWGKRDALDLVEQTSDHRAGFDWWAFQPLKPGTPPNLNDTAWLKQPLDRFVRARLEEKGLTPGPEADRRTLIRRVTFDLIG